MVGDLATRVPVGAKARLAPARVHLPVPSPLTIWCGALALAGVVFAPLLRSGTVFFLDYGDYPVGPHPHLSGSVWGLSPGLTSRTPITVVLVGAFRAMHWGPVRLAPLVLVPLLAALGLARLFDR